MVKNIPFENIFLAPITNAKVNIILLQQQDCIVGAYIMFVSRRKNKLSMAIFRSSTLYEAQIEFWGDN